MGVSIFLGNAPPPPVVVYREPPRWAFVPEERVYYVDDPECDYDYFHYGTYFYIFNDGYWYRGSSYRGPFRAIRADYVPRPIFSVPAGRYHRRHAPPGWKHGEKRGWGRDADHDRGRDRDRDHDRDHGHDHGHGHHGD